MYFTAKDVTFPGRTLSFQIKRIRVFLNISTTVIAHCLNYLKVHIIQNETIESRVPLLLYVFNYRYDYHYFLITHGN